MLFTFVTVSPFNSHVCNVDLAGWPSGSLPLLPTPSSPHLHLHLFISLSTNSAKFSSSFFPCWVFLQLGEPSFHISSLLFVLLRLDWPQGDTTLALCHGSGYSQIKTDPQLFTNWDPSNPQCKNWTKPRARDVKGMHRLTLLLGLPVP